MDNIYQQTRWPFSPLTDAEKLADVPNSSGVYIFFGQKGEILYLGKAKELRKRLRSYCRRSNHYKTDLLVKKVAYLEYILTDNEVEALILEASMIKKHQPYYNILLKDDKKYPYVKLSIQEKFPAVYVTRLLKDDGARYFGPYTDVGSLRRTLRVIREFFPLRDCRKISGKKLCLNFHIGRCKGPCEGKVTVEQYRKDVEEVLLFLTGHTRSLEKRLAEQMKTMADEMNFEVAAVVREKLSAIKAISGGQKMDAISDADEDFMSVYIENDKGCGVVLCQRAGKIVGRCHFVLEHLEKEDEAEVLESFITQYYANMTELPKALNLGGEIKNTELMETWLAQKAGRKVYLQTPKRGDKARLVKLAKTNAGDQFRLYNAIEQKRDRKDEGEGGELAMILDMAEPVTRIEAFDISNLHGTNPVGGVVVWQDGQFYKKDYRHYKIKEVEGIDDYAMLKEVIKRRYTKPGRNTPDVILIDGGLGQLSGVLETLKEYGVEYKRVISLAKREEEVYMDHCKIPLSLPLDSDPLKLLMKIRDEVHRFSISFHRRLRRKGLKETKIRAVPGVGANIERALIRHFDRPDQIFLSTIEELTKVSGVSSALAERIIKWGEKAEGSE